MYELFDKLKPYFKEEFEDDFFSSPASLADVEKIENTIGIKLPESYKQFLLKFNDFAIDSLDLFTTNKLLSFVNEWGFKKWEGELEFDYEEGQMKEYYSDKPLHLLVFAHNSTCYCFDTGTMLNNEYKICTYDPESETEKTLKPKYDSFYDFILEKSDYLLDDIEMPDSWFSDDSFLDRLKAL